MGDAPERRTLKELGAPDLAIQGQPAWYPELNANFELKTGLIGLLPKFHGLPGEDPIKHLKDFEIVCATTRRTGGDEDSVKAFAFPFSFEGKARDWYYTLPRDTLTNWPLFQKRFLEKYFPTTRTNSIRKEISSITQLHGESLHEYYERYKKLLSSCPHHSIPDHLLINYFYEGLTYADKSIIDASSGGCLTNKSPEEAWVLIEEVADAHQHFRTKTTTTAAKGIYEVAPSESTVLAKSLVDIAAMLKEIKEGQQAMPKLLKSQPTTSQSQSMPVKYCGICSCNSHHTDECPQLQEDSQVASTHNFYEAPPSNKQYYTNGWSSNQQNRWNAQQQNQQGQYRPQQQQTYSYPQNQPNQKYQPPHQRQNYQINAPPTQVDEVLRAFQQESRELKEAQKRQEAQMNNLTEMFSRFMSNSQAPAPQASSSNQIPAQPVANPKGGINVLRIQGGKIIDEEEVDEEDEDWLYDLLSKMTSPDGSDDDEDESEEDDDEEEESEDEAEEEEKADTDPMMEDTGAMTEDSEERFFLATIHKHQPVNKEELPQKCEDPGPCLVDCVIERKIIPRCMCDPGACGSVMSYELYKALDLGPLKKIDGSFSMADKSIVSMAGMVENVLVGIGKLVIPTDFHVIHMMDSNFDDETSLLLGRPFLKTASFRLNYHENVYTFEVGNEIEVFDLKPQNGKKKNGIHRLRLFEDKPREDSGREVSKERPPPSLPPPSQFAKIKGLRVAPPEESHEKKGPEEASKVEKAELSIAPPKEAEKKKEAKKEEKKDEVKKERKEEVKKKKKKKEKEEVKKKKKRKEKSEEEKSREKVNIKCACLNDLKCKLQKLGKALQRQNKMKVHLVEDNSKWK